MTREAIEYFKFYRKIFCEDHLKICPKDSIAYQATLKEKEFYDMAIKALEQEPVIDKIRAEIKKSSYGKWYVGRLDGKTEEVLLLDEVLQIIDKYMAESDDKDV